jgi:hypothetical protein
MPANTGEALGWIITPLVEVVMARRRADRSFGSVN